MPTMSTPTSSSTRAGRHRTTAAVLRFAAVAALVVSAAVHAALAGLYGAGLPGITLGKQFVVQAALTAVVAGWLLLRDTPLAWLAGAIVMVGTLAAILAAHTGSGLPQLGPLPGIREQGYDGRQLLTMAAEALYLVFAAIRVLTRGSR